VRDAVDVRDAVVGIAHDRHAGPRLLGRGDVLGAERRVLEEAPLVGRLRGDEAVVQRLLIVPVRGPRAGGEERREVERVVVAVLARRQDVAKAAGVVGAVGLGGGHRRRGKGGRCGRRGHAGRAGRSGGGGQCDRSGGGGQEQGGEGGGEQGAHGAGP
jgi:hypothetical protein